MKPLKNIKRYGVTATLCLLVLLSMLVFQPLMLTHSRASNMDNSLPARKPLFLEKKEKKKGDMEIDSSHVFTTSNEEFCDDRVIVTLKNKYSIINNLAVVENLKKGISVSVDDAKVEKTGLKKIEFEAVQDLTYATEDGKRNGLLDLDRFNQVLLLKLKEKSKQNVLKTISELEKLETVLFAKPDYIYKEIEYYTPSDPLYSGNNEKSQWGLRKIGMDSAWNLTKGSNNVKVGIMEGNGVTTHSDYVQRLLPGNVPLSSNGSHGSGVAGIISAVHNSIGIAGIAQASIIPLDAQYSSGFVNSITFARNNNIRIINASFGYPRASNNDVPDYNHRVALWAYNGLLVCAAGNEGQELSPTNKSYPASYNQYHDNVVAVGATDFNDARAIYKDDRSSNYGAYVDFFAPGANMPSTFPEAMCDNGSCGGANGGHISRGHHLFGGTSAAAPHVAGVAALLLSLNGSLTGPELASHMWWNSDTISISTPKGGWSVQRLSAYKALAAYHGIAPGGGGPKHGKNYKIQNRNTGQYLTVDSSSTGTGKVIKQAASNGSIKQTFILLANTDGSVSFEPKFNKDAGVNNTRLDLTWFVFYGFRLYVQSGNGSEWQKFYPELYSGNYYRFKLGVSGTKEGLYSLGSGKEVGVANQSTNQNQQWQFVAV